MTTPDVNVILVDFPNSGKEMVVPNEDGSYTILINAKLSAEQRLKSYEHAMKHIEEEDFSKSNVQEIECRAHNVVVPDNADRITKDKFEKEILRIRRRRKKLKKQMEEYERDMRFIATFSGDDSVFERTAERKWLYGGIE